MFTLKNLACKELMNWVLIVPGCGLSPVWHQDITWANTDLSSTDPCVKKNQGISK